MKKTLLFLLTFAFGLVSKAEDLGRKLRDYGLFEQYEDRFYGLYMQLKRS